MGKRLLSAALASLIISAMITTLSMFYVTLSVRDVSVGFNIESGEFMKMFCWCFLTAFFSSLLTLKFLSVQR